MFDGEVSNKHDCNASHVKEPSNWYCPVCFNITSFVIVETDEMADDFCDFLHVADLCECDNCGYAGSGKDISKLLTGSRVKCTHCDGIGWIIEKQNGA